MAASAGWRSAGGGAKSASRPLGHPLLLAIPIRFAMQYVATCLFPPTLSRVGASPPHQRQAACLTLSPYVAALPSRCSSAASSFCCSATGGAASTVAAWLATAAAGCGWRAASCGEAPDPANGRSCAAHRRPLLRPPACLLAARRLARCCRARLGGRQGRWSQACWHFRARHGDCCLSSRAAA